MSVGGPFFVAARSVRTKRMETPAGAKRRGEPPGAHLPFKPWPCGRSQVPTAGRTPWRTPVKLTGAFFALCQASSREWARPRSKGLRNSAARQPAAASGRPPMEKDPCIPMGESPRRRSRGLTAKPPSRRASAPRSGAPAPWRRRRGGGSRAVQLPYIDKGMSPADTPINAWQDP